jgi:hypothetical protein
MSDGILVNEPLTATDIAFLSVGLIGVAACAVWALHAFLTRRKQQDLWI